MMFNCMKCGSAFFPDCLVDGLCVKCNTTAARQVAALLRHDSVAAKRRQPIAPFTVLVDQQEGLPYTFSSITSDARQHRRKLHVPIRTVHLLAGDYSIDGFGDQVAVERKTLSDFCRSFGAEYDREKRKVSRLALMTVAWYVLEFDFLDLCGPPPPYSSVGMKSLRRKIMASQVRHPNVQWWFAGNREAAEVVTYRLLEKWWNNFVEVPEMASGRMNNA